MSDNSSKTCYQLVLQYRIIPPGSGSLLVQIFQSSIGPQVPSEQSTRGQKREVVFLDKATFIYLCFQVGNYLTKKNHPR